jgi:large subunit ribosomal protein L17
MRKLNKGRKFSRKKGPRIALLKTLSNSFFMYEKIKTTEAKAKELRPIVEKMITRAKANEISGRRILAKSLNVKMVKKLFDHIAPQYKDRNSDGARIAIIELVK